MQMIEYVQLTANDPTGLNRNGQIIGCDQRSLKSHFTRDSQHLYIKKKQS